MFICCLLYCISKLSTCGRGYGLNLLKNSNFLLQFSVLEKFLKNFPRIVDSLYCVNRRCSSTQAKLTSLSYLAIIVRKLVNTDNFLR